ncbi:ABC transporter permease [Gemmatimonas sp. UBA7669]|uniref:ABC transporter permease n=1 Tax=Gemmatimonas sp. UBA7669 TaxID=1946568 RepID=UPI0025B7C927|nr:ABC transporter permease [Gemmatimonas sp. UBA7669]
MSARIDALGENVRMAIEALRVSKMRSALTILGVVIGVATVMAMAAIVQGIRDQIVNTIEVAGPSTFYVLKKFSQTPLNPDDLPKDVRIRPDLVEREAERIKALPEIAYASLWAQTLARIESPGVRSQGMAIFGADDGFTQIQGGELVEGRWFTKAEITAGAPVVVLQEETARRLYGQERLIGRSVQIGGRPLEVIGLWAEPGNIFAPPGQAVGAIVPYRFMDRAYPIDRTNALFIPVKPRAGVRVSDAQSAVEMTLRESRRLRPGDGNTFDLVSQDQILDTFNSITGVFFLVMIVLSGVALLVGGIGVMAIMTVSVTSRTREIGVRKALGATKRDILVQFLVEASTLTGIGGAIGILVGLALGRVVSLAMDIDAPVPVTLTLIAVVVSVSIGIVFGMIPARRAARLDPIEALRYE